MRRSPAAARLKIMSLVRDQAHRIETRLLLGTPVTMKELELVLGGVVKEFAKALDSGEFRLSDLKQYDPCENVSELLGRLRAGALGAAGAGYAVRKKEKTS